MTLSNLEIGHRLGAGFGMVILLMIVITSIGVLRLFQSNISIDTMVNERYPETILAGTIKSDSDAVMTSMRNILIEPGTMQSELLEIDQSINFVTENIEKLSKTMLASEDGKVQIQDLLDTRKLFLSNKNQFVQLVTDGKIDEAKNMFGKVSSSGNTYLESVDRLIFYEKNIVEKAGKEVTATSKKALLVMAILAAIASVLGIGIGTIVTRSITKPLTEAVGVAKMVAEGDLTVDIQIRSNDETGKLMQALGHMNQSLVKIVREVRSGTGTIASASTQIASGNLDLSRRTEQQADSLEKIASSMMELTKTVKQNADNAAMANQLGISATATAVKGGSVVSQVIDTMGEIKDSSRKIVDIIGIIDSIAFQTNILALNAAVEAARAGDQGRGFAVVAAEVRNLAQRSAGAAKEIKSLIRVSVEEVDAGKALVDEAGGTMNEILTSVKRVADLMSEITAASQEQSSGIESVTQAIRQMDEMTQQNGALVEDASAASKSLQIQAKLLAQTVSVFKLHELEIMENSPAMTEFTDEYVTPINKRVDGLTYSAIG